ncbi:unnamed protein product [Lactuca virosa]|uniref:Protein kinase domain-containing protein n=1 Tax=Lactuca virosa TaxID=75947 RepID=A0AAU9P5A0_9ASTR|nr:unnamed protein product [Lactuca virosa]
MEAFLGENQHLKIKLEEIKSATNNFDNNNVIGKGGFGNVYKGVLSHSEGLTMVAFKRLDRKLGQGNPEFLKEILMLSRYTHENLISLLGFCDEDDEKILVYEHAYHGSLDRHLSANTLTWWKRLKICLTAAKGLCYLHDPKGTEQRVIHRDIKSSNILLDESWNAKLSDMGLSKIGPANQQHSFLTTNVVGTYGYIDPLYMETYLLTKESDVYSFGMVLFEVLCGRLCYEYNNGHFMSLWPMWKKSYEEKKLDQIIFEDLKEHMNPSSLETFSGIAYRCLQKSREERPKMSDVVEELEIALDIQKTEGPMDFEEMIETAVAPHVYKSKEELQMLLYKGMLVNGGKTWFSLNKNGEHCEMISAKVCLIPILPASPRYAYNGLHKSRFPLDNENTTPLCWRFKMHVKAQFLSPHITYAVNLVFGVDYESMDLLFLNYKLAEETCYSTSYIADEREDGWFTTELYQFTSLKKSADFDITFDCGGHPLIVEAIEFQPIERVDHHQLLEDEKVDMPETYWEQRLPSDYEDILKSYKNSAQWTTKKELYSILCKGFPINNGEEWFSLANNGKKCHMLPARMALRKLVWRWGPSRESRFKEVAFCTQQSFSITCTSKMLSPQTRYACFLVYNIQTKNPNVGQVVEVSDQSRITESGEYDPHHILLFLPETPIIRQKVNDNTHIHNPLKRTKMEGVPQRRNDGWLEVQVWKCQTGATTSENPLFDLYFNLRSFSRITELSVQGIEFKAI